MLVQHRAINESILIGKKGDVLDGPIMVTVVDAKKYHCRLGVTAPKKIIVYRPESQILPITEVVEVLGKNIPIVGTADEPIAQAGVMQ